VNGHPRSGFLRIARALVLLVYAVVMAYVVILSIAFFLQLLGASPTASFTDWVYRAAARIMEPFRGIFPTKQVSDESVFNASMLFAVVIYSLFATLLQAGVLWLSGHIYQRENAQGEPPAELPAAAGPRPGAYQSGYSAAQASAPDQYSYPSQRNDPSTSGPR
jgi:uncharacterized protein YggT (Ycf19 family)